MLGEFVRHWQNMREIGPFVPLGGGPFAPGWAGNASSAWAPVVATVAPFLDRATWLYRFRGSADDRLLYVGQRLIRTRLAADLAKGRIPARGKFGLFAAGPARLLVGGRPGLAAPPAAELENDLIAEHLIATSELPSAQFLG